MSYDDVCAFVDACRCVQALMRIENRQQKVCSQHQKWLCFTMDSALKTDVL